MPQLDKLTFTTQIFWFLFLFIFLYYFFIQIVVLRIKFSLGLKRFFLQNDKSSNFYDLVKVLNLDSRHNLMFFFSSDIYIDQNSKNIFSYYISSLFNYLSKFIVSDLSRYDSSNEYTFLLDFNKDYYLTIYNNVQKEKYLDFKSLNFWTKNIQYFYERFNYLISFFFKSIQFYIYEVNFTLFYYFFNVFFKFRNTLYFIKLLNKI